MPTNGNFLEGHRQGFDDGTAVGWEAGYRQALQDNGLSLAGLVPAMTGVEYVAPVAADLNQSLEELQDNGELSVRGYNCLKREEIYTVGDLVGKTEADILDIRNLGEKTLKEIKTLLAERGLELKSLLEAPTTE